MLLLGGLVLLLCAAGTYIASSWPDGLEKISLRLGFAGKAKPVARAPLADYQFAEPGSSAGGRIAAALIGAAVCFLAAYGIGQYSARREQRLAPRSARPLE